MTTPTGLLSWGQQGQYTARDDRLVIRALCAGRSGIVIEAQFEAGAGLTVHVFAGWLAVADVGDGTEAVFAGSTDAFVTATAGGTAARTDHIWADPDPDSGRWLLRVVSAVAAVDRPGISLGTIAVPAGAALASQMSFTPAPALFNAFGMPGPMGPQGPQGVPGPVGPVGPMGPPGGSISTGVIILGTVANAAGLPASGNPGEAWITADTLDLFVWPGLDSLTIRGGTVATVSDLPASGNETDDAWIVEATGDLYVWRP